MPRIMYAIKSEMIGLTESDEEILFDIPDDALERAASAEPNALT